MGIAHRINQALEDAGLNQETAAGALNKSVQTIRNWRDDGRPEEPRHSDILRLAEITGKPISFFFPTKQPRRSAVKGQQAGKRS